jgi:hypothetical protein
MFENAGRALAIIHAGLQLPSEWKIPLRKEFAGGGPGVFLHGDFNVANVCYDVPHQRLVIIDWSAAPDFGGNFSFGSRYFDLAWFCFCLFCSVPLHRITNWADEELALALLNGYALEGGVFDWAAFREYARILSRPFRTVQRGKINRGHPFKRPAYALLQSLVWLRWQRFLRTAEPEFRSAPVISTSEATSA